MNMRLRPVVAQAEPPAEGRQGRFHLEYGTERTALDPGRTWIQVDRFKWVTRGVIEPPQSFSVHPDGSVDFNGDTFRPDDPEAAGRLTEQINKRHASAAPATRGSPTSPTSPTSHTDNPGAGRLPFRVRLDPLGHLLIEARRGDERTETGLRGLEHLAVDGWLRRPGQIHVDPLQRYLELDGRRFDCTAEGAAELEDALNRLYAPAQTGNHDAAIEVRENPAASSGFDIRFWILRAGTRFEVHGHLSQEKLDILQDHDRCDLLQPGVLLRLSPPFLYLRRRRSDGGEEPIPGLPDVKYRGITASELQRILNHPSLRRSGGARDETPVVDALPQSPASLRVVRHPEDHHHLWLEIVGLDGRTRQRALTHPNLVELQNSGCFREGIDVALSLDQAELSLHQAGAAPRTFALSAATDSATLETLSGLLTGALRPPSSPAGDTHPAGNSPAPESPPAAPPKVLPQAAVTPLPARPSPKPPPVPPPTPGPPTAKAPPPPVLPRPPAAPDLDPGVRALFHEADPHRVNEEIFRVLSERMHLPVQDLLLSLPHVFEDRRFEVLDFQGDVIESVLQLRSGRFYGLYLTHIGPERIDLVYACHGTHIEWGTDKCAFQPGAGAETLEWRGPGLLGLAQDPENRFVFIVRDRYLDWIKPHERVCTEAFALFRTVGGWATERDRMPLIWPVAPMPAG